MKKLLIIPIIFFCFLSYGQKKDSTAKPLTDSTALLSIRDVNKLLEYLSDMEMRPSLFMSIKNSLDQLIQQRIRELNKPKQK